MNKWVALVFVAIGLFCGNAIWSWTHADPTLSKAIEHSYFQVISLFAYCLVPKKGKE